MSDIKRQFINGSKVVRYIGENWGVSVANRAGSYSVRNGSGVASEVEIAVFDYRGQKEVLHAVIGYVPVKCIPSIVKAVCMLGPEHSRATAFDVAGDVIEEIR